MRTLILTATAAAWSLMALPALAAADITGTYQVQGWNPSATTAAKPSYRGTLTLTQAGELIQAVWHTGGPPIEGVGILSEVGGQRLLSLSYIEAAHPAFAVYTISADGQQLTGKWGAQTKVGREVGTR